MHDAVKRAICNAAEAEGQSTSVAKRLNAWLDRLSDGACSLESSGDVEHRIELILDKTEVPEDNGESREE